MIRINSPTPPESEIVKLEVGWKFPFAPSPKLKVKMTKVHPTPSRLWKTPAYQIDDRHMFCCISGLRTKEEVELIRDVST